MLRSHLRTLPLLCVVAVVLLSGGPCPCVCGILDSFWSSDPPAPDPVADVPLVDLPFQMESNAPWDNIKAILERRTQAHSDYVKLMSHWREADKQAPAQLLKTARSTAVQVLPKWMRSPAPVLANRDGLRSHLALPLAGDAVTALHTIPFSLQSSFSRYFERSSFPPEFGAEWRALVSDTDRRCRSLDEAFSKLPSSFGDRRAAELLIKHLLQPADEVMAAELGPLVGTQQQHYETLKSQYARLRTSVTSKEALQKQGEHPVGLAKAREDLREFLARQLIPAVRELRHMVKTAPQRQLQMHLTANLTAGLNEVRAFMQRLQHKHDSLVEDVRAHEAWIQGTTQHREHRDNLWIWIALVLPFR